MDYLKKIQPPASQEIQEMAYLFLPQIWLEKLPSCRRGIPRKAGYEEAIKQYDALIQKFPDSDRMEKIRCRYAHSPFFNLKNTRKQPQPCVQTSRNTPGASRFWRASICSHSLYLAAQAATMLQARPGDPQAFAKYDEAAKLLGDIIQKHTDVAVANDAQFQLGEASWAAPVLWTSPGSRQLLQAPSRRSAQWPQEK